MGFQMVPKYQSWMTLMADTHSVGEKMRLLEPTA